MLCNLHVGQKNKQQKRKRRDKKYKALLTLLTICIHAHPQTSPQAIVYLHPPQHITMTLQLSLSLVDCHKLILSFSNQIKKVRVITSLLICSNPFLRFLMSQDINISRNRNWPWTNGKYSSLFVPTIILLCIGF